MFSNYSLFHELQIPEIHTWGDIAFWIGVIGGLAGIFYFVILKIMDIRDRTKEHNAFMEDIKSEINDLTKSPDKYMLNWDGKRENLPSGFGYFSFDTFTLFNNKYRHLFNKKTRDLISKLNMEIILFNNSVVDLHEIEINLVFKNKACELEMRAGLSKYNSELVRIKNTAIELNKLIIITKNPILN